MIQRQIKYTNTIINNTEEVSVETIGMADYKLADGYENISFMYRGSNIEIKYGKQSVVLRNGRSKLMFKKDAIMENKYDVPYGTLTIQTKIERYEVTDNTMTLEYSLMQNDEIISRAVLNIEYLVS